LPSPARPLALNLDLLLLDLFDLILDLLRLPCPSSSASLLDLFNLLLDLLRFPPPLLLRPPAILLRLPCPFPSPSPPAPSPPSPAAFSFSSISSLSFFGYRNGFWYRNGLRCGCWKTWRGDTGRRGRFWKANEPWILSGWTREGRE
jgi:hypothetical protein